MDYRPPFINAMATRGSGHFKKVNNMADAKSRYEIVQEITEKKQGCLDQISSLDAGFARNKSQIAQMERAHARENKTRLEQQTQALEDLRANVLVEEKNIAERKEMLERKVAAYEEAITALKAISQSAGETKTA